MGVASILLVAVLAGCISENPEPVAPAPVSTQVDDSNTTTPAKVATTPTGRVYRMDAHDLTYQNQILRTTIVADEPLNVSLRAESLVAASHYDDGCAAVGITLEEPGAPTRNTVLVTFYSENDMPVTLSAGDEEFVVQGDGTATAETLGFPFSLRGNFTVPAGGRLHLELGGRDGSFTDTPARSIEPNGKDGTRLWIEANITGASHVAQATPSPVRCGMGPRQFENATLGASAWLSHSVLDGAVGLDTTRGSSLLWLDAFPFTEPDVTFEFLNQTHPYAPLVAMSHLRTGHIGIQAASWVDPLPAAGWFLGDVYWPVLNDLELQG